MPQLSSFLDYLRYIVAGDVAASWKQFGQYGDYFRSIAVSLMEIGFSQNAEAAFCVEKYQH